MNAGDLATERAGSWGIFLLGLKGFAVGHMWMCVYLPLCVDVCLRVCECVSERESVCVCMCFILY